MSEHTVFYLSGPMSGYENYNYKEFERVTNLLRDEGYLVISPHEIPPPDVPYPTEEGTWQYYLAQCHLQIELCQAIILLRGWPESRGARTELNWALNLKFPVYYFDHTDHLIRMSR